MFKTTGINTLGELKQALEDDTLIRSLGRKCLDEVLEIIQTDNGDGFETFSIIIDGQKTIYKYSTQDEEKISRSILKELMQFKVEFCNIFKSSFSPGLIDVLLMKGYLFEEDVIADFGKISQELISFGFENYAQEIEGVKGFYNLSDDNKKVYVVFDEAILQLITDESIENYRELVNAVERKNDEDLLETIKKISEYLFSTEE